MRKLMRSIRRHASKLTVAAVVAASTVAAHATDPGDPAEIATAATTLFATASALAVTIAVFVVGRRLVLKLVK